MIEVKVWAGHEFWDARSKLEAELEVSLPEKALRKRIRYFAPEFLDNQVTFSIEVDGVVAGLAGFEPAPTHGILWLCYVCLDVLHQGQKLSSKLLAFAMDWAAAQNYRVVNCSGYSKLGLERLRPVLLRESARVGLTLSDRPVVEYN